jgi:hypothetical protein
LQASGIAEALETPSFEGKTVLADAIFVHLGSIIPIPKTLFFDAAGINQQQATALGSIRCGVEHYFGGLQRMFPLIALKAKNKVLATFPCSKVKTACLLYNLRVLLRGCQQSTYYNLGVPFTIEEYLHQ